MTLPSQDDLCNNSEWACTISGNDVGIDPKTQSGYAVDNGGLGGGGTALGTIRAYASLDVFLSPRFSLGTRLGYAFSGGTPTTNTTFMPYHAELRAQYFLSPISSAGLKPYLQFAFGLGEFDAALSNIVVIPSAGQTGPDGTQYDGQKLMSGVTGYHLAGKEFVGIGGGIWYMFSPSVALNFGVRALLTMPTFAYGFAPEAGLKFGF
jgi:hypothetical protein